MYEVRLQALELALDHTRARQDSSDEVLSVASKFYSFLMGEERDLKTDGR